MLEKKYIIFGAIAAVIAVGLIIASISLIFTKPKTASQPTEKTNPIQQARNLITQTTPDNKTETQKPLPKGSIHLILGGGKTSFKVGEEIILIPVIDSDNTSLASYDLAFKFDKNLVSYASEKNLYPDFSYFRKLLENKWVSITARKKADVSSEAVFKGRPVLEIRFKALKAGSASFPVSFIPGSTKDSNLLDENSQDILQSVKGISVKITN